MLSYSVNSFIKTGKKIKNDLYDDYVSRINDALRGDFVEAGN